MAKRGRKPKNRQPEPVETPIITQSPTGSFVTTPTAEELEALRGEELIPDPEVPQPDPPLPKPQVVVEYDIDAYLRELGARARIILQDQRFVERKVNPFAHVFANQARIGLFQALEALDRFIEGEHPRDPLPGDPWDDMGASQPLSSAPNLTALIGTWAGALTRKIDFFHRPPEPAEEAHGSGR